MHTIYLTNHGWHTGIVILASQVFSEIPALEEQFANAEYLEIGWGDAGFYQANEIDFFLAIEALFWPTGSIVHVVGFQGHPKTYFKNSDVFEIRLYQSQLPRLIEFMEHSFRKNDHDSIVKLTPGIYGDSWFYAGVGSYSAFNTCNKWTAKALYSGGLVIDPMFKFTASSVVSALDIDEPAN